MDITVKSGIRSCFTPGPKRLDQPVAEALIAEVDGEPVAAVIIFRFAGKAWYLYGMSRTAHRDKMPNYLLQWEAIKRAKAAGCTVYDLWGAPDEFVETDPLWGVFRFKEGLGGTVHRYLGAWDLPVNRMLYRLYTRTLPGLLDIMRKHGKASTKQEYRTISMRTIPRIKFAQLPTPIEALPRLSAKLGGPKLFVKRDDLTGLAFGGNKIRKLEYLLAEAQAHGAQDDHYCRCSAIQPLPANCRSLCPSRF